MSDMPCATDHFREGLISLMALAHQSVPPQEIVFAGISLFTSYCYEMAPDDDVADRTIEASLQDGKESNIQSKEWNSYE